MIAEYFPEEIKHTKPPEGGMFLWITLPEGISSLDLFDLAIKENVAFVLGNAFYVDIGGNNTLRLNFSNSDEEEIEEGIKRLAKIIKKSLFLDLLDYTKTFFKKKVLSKNSFFGKAFL